MVVFPPRPSASAHGRILIVEDEGIIASHIASRLIKTGYDVAGIAESSEEALTKISELVPDLILMDIRIKGAMDGIQTTSKLRELFDIPVIYLTAHTDQKTIDRAKMTGASGFLSKPIHHTSLATSIEMAIHKHRSDRGARDQRAWMATVLGTMADAMIVIDRDRKVQFLNGPAEEITGWGVEEAREQDVGVILPLTEAGQTEQENGILSLPGDSQPPRQMPRGLMARSRSGKRFPIEGEIAPSVDSGRVAGAVITFRDATSRRAQENELRQEYKMEAVGRLAAGIAHDFNNLLLIILGYTDEMLRTASPHGGDLHALTQIRKAGETATNITQQLLKFSRREAMEKMELDLNELIGDMEELLRRASGNSVKWQFTLDRKLSSIRADPAQLRQVLMNLASNARDAMPDGGKITVVTANIELPCAGRLANTREPFIALSVTDSGSGMSAETAERLFEPFFTTREPGKGTGLGLSIVHSIVTDLGGTILVDSEPGHGATFTIYLPCAPHPLPLAADATPRGASDPVTVLLVEDQLNVRRVLSAYLAGSGYTVLEAENGEDAIRIASDHTGSIDVLISDVVMPKAGGFEIARALAARWAEMKVIFISGYAEEMIGKEAKLPPGACFLPKPFVKKELLRHVGEVLAKKMN